jgi:hypothetical protein
MALRDPAAWAGLCSLAAAGSCGGLEVDVLSLRPTPDMAAVDAGPMPPPSCQTQSLNVMSCVDAAVWQMKAQEICYSLGRTIGKLELAEPCMGMMGTAQSYGVRFECCPTSPPLPPICTPRLQGDGMSCLQAWEWLDSAALDCSSRGEKAAMWALGDPCAPLRYRLVKYMCCKDPAAMPLVPTAHNPL